MGKTIWANVYVTTPAGETKLYLAGDEVPDEDAKLITSPVWDKPKDLDEEAERPRDPRQDAQFGQHNPEVPAPASSPVEVANSTPQQTQAEADAARVQQEAEAAKATHLQELTDELGKLNKNDLVARAQGEGVELKGDETKDQIVELIKNHEG